MSGSLADVPGVRVGSVGDPVGLTGCTVVLAPPGTVGSGEVRGGAPGTRETDLLRPGTLVEHVHAVLLTGGSAFGLAAADGVMRFLEERGIGFDTGVAKVPIVPAAVLFDLAIGDPAARPGPDDGYAACVAASDHVEEGSVGAGTGATVAKLHGPGGQVKGGLGTASLGEGDAVVGALVAVNALGEVVDEAGGVIAGARPDAEASPRPGNTTIGVVATNARLDKESAQRLAAAGQDGIAAAIRPSHTTWDGDTIFALATGGVEARQPVLEGLARRVVAEAIRRAVRICSGVPGAPAVGEAP